MAYRLEDAIRAIKDRPSMEAELEMLRDKATHYEMLLSAVQLIALLDERVGLCGACHDHIGGIAVEMAQAALERRG
jgi:hypothetical protein